MSKTNSPLVSFLMPVYNSTDFSRGNGAFLLPLALDSLLAQTYTNFEIVILDNQSTDKTADICKSYEQKDSRIRYFRDDQQRYPEGALSKLGSLIKGKYCAIANDDDLWDPHFLAKTVERLEMRPELHMVYTNSRHVDVTGRLGDGVLVGKGEEYRISSSPFTNFSKYVVRRSVIPIIFGLFRTDVFVNELLPFEPFDELKANVDNLFILNFFLKGLKCDFIDEPLFFYRQKVRTLDSSKEEGLKKRLPPDMPDIDEPLPLWLYYVRHQLYFLNKVTASIRKRNLNGIEEAYLRAVTQFSFGSHILNLLDWISRDYVRSSSPKPAVIDRRYSGKSASEVFEEIEKGLKDCQESTLFSAPEPLNFNPFFVSNLKQKSKKQTDKILSVLKASFRVLGDKKHEQLVSEIGDLLSDQDAFFAKVQTWEEQFFTKDPLILGTKETPQIKTVGQNPRVSILTPSFNTGVFIKDTFASIQNQSYEDWEHVVVDGGSTDNSIAEFQKYPNIRLIVGKDSGVPEAMRKAIKIAHGDYVFSCCISDGYLDPEWFKKCVEVLDTMPEVSLVWGLPRYISEDNQLGPVSFADFHEAMPPQKEGFFQYWLQYGFWFPEGNFCVRKRVMDECFPPWPYERTREYDPWLEFNYNFEAAGYLPYFLSSVANFGRIHRNQNGERERQSGAMKERLDHYHSKRRALRNSILRGGYVHHFRKGDGTPLGVTVNRKEVLTALGRHYLDGIEKIAESHPVVVQMMPAKVKGGFRLISSYLRKTLGP